MKKRILAIALCGLMLCGCGEREGVVSDSMLEYISSATEYDSGMWYQVNTIPFDKIAYNDSEFSLVDFSFYEAESNYKYFLYASITFDVSNLTDSEIYWLHDERELTIDSVFFSDDANAMSTETMFQSDSWVSDGKLYYIYYLDDYGKYSFSDARFFLRISVQQDETYESDGGNELNKSDTYEWSGMKADDEDCKAEFRDISEIPQEE